MANVFVSDPLKFADRSLECAYARADLQLLGLRHSGPSFEGRIFLNNPNANVDTPPTEAEGYAGCFFIFGHGGCFGSQGHCHLPERRSTDPRPPHSLTPMTKAVEITRALRRHVTNEGAFTVTVVADPFRPAVPDDGEEYLQEFACDYDNVLRFDELRVVTYD
jgi:tyrosinase